MMEVYLFFIILFFHQSIEQTQTQQQNYYTGRGGNIRAKAKQMKRGRKKNTQTVLDLGGLKF